MPGADRSITDPKVKHTRNHANEIATYVMHLQAHLIGADYYFATDLQRREELAHAVGTAEYIKRIAAAAEADLRKLFQERYGRPARTWEVRPPNDDAAPGVVSTGQ